MINVIKSEFYKLRHNKSYWAIVLIAIIFYTYLLVHTTIAESYDANMTSLCGILPIFGALIVISITRSDYTSGTMKNIVSVGVSRTSIYFGKLITAFLASMLIFVLEAIITTVIYANNNLDITIDFMLFIKSFALQALIVLNYCVIFFLIGNVIKNSALAFAICFVIYMFAAAAFGLVGNYLHVSNLANYELGTIAGAVEKVNISTVAVEHLLCISVIIVIFSVIGSLVFKKLEIK